MEILFSLWEQIASYATVFAHNAGTGFEYFFTLQNMLAIFGGTAIGIFFGALPGLTVTMTVALTVPFIFGLDPLTAISLLLAEYVGGIYGGSISAILLNVPGTPAATCTCLDGFKLTQKGKAGKALQMANWASCVGDLFSTSVVILVLPLMGNIALYFKSPEYFALILFAITIIGGVSGKSITKGLIAASLGFLAAMVGMDPFTGSGRFDFGSLELIEGFSFIPLLIGLFALPEVLIQFNRSKRMKGTARITTTDSAHASDSRLTWREFRGSLGHMVRGGFVGLILGVIPGLGATPSAFLTYEWSRRKSKHPEEFGNGSLEGVAAAEAGNNAVNGATLVPLLTLGIPGDIVTAVILGSFMIFGLRPGPLLFVEHIDLIFGLLCTLIMCDLALRLVGSFFIKYAHRITKVPTSVVFPAIIILCFFGSYAINNSLFDIAIMLLFGLLGYCMALVEMPAIPFLIAFVLAPMLERGLRRSLVISDGNPLIFFQSPIAVLFLVLAVVTVISITRTRYKIRIKEEE